jgi:4-amino-4-deoxy-L-arabinose transferase-like glycosyltransferase
VRYDDAPRPAPTPAATLRRDGALVLIYLLVTALTSANFMGDTLYYADSVLGMAAGRITPSVWDARGNYSFFEFGHLLWRPLGCALYLLCGSLARRLYANDARDAALFVLVAANWAAGLASVLLLRRVLGYVARREWIVVAASVGFVCAYGFLNFTQSGSSYVPALALYLAGLLAMLRGGERVEHAWRTTLAAGALLAGAVCLWFLYVWVVPVALAAPLVLFGDDVRRRRLLINGALASGGLTILVYACVVVFGLHVADVATLKAWVASSGHELENNRGLLQVGFGLSRSFLSVGHDNVLFKRFLLHDTYNPVSFFDLFRLSLWKLALFYLAWAATLVLLVGGGSHSRRVLWLLLLGASPILLFAALWQGTTPERYLPLYPVAFAALACALDAGRGRAVLKTMLVGFIIALVCVNVGALLNFALGRRQAEMTARTQELLPLLKRESVVVEVKEELKDLQWEFPFHPLNRVLTVYSAISIGDAASARWREQFAAKALETWDAGGDVWLSRRVLEASPRAASYWVEGSDPGIAWAQISAFFNSFERGREVGGADGFVLLAHTARNEEALRAINHEQLTTNNGQTR